MLDSKSCETLTFWGFNYSLLASRGGAPIASAQLLGAFFAERKKSLWSDLAHENTRNTFLIRVALKHRIAEREWHIELQST